MEAKKQGAGEEDLSMEDILQSIRRIIADESDEPKAAGAPSDASKDNASFNNTDAPSDILELTDMIEEEEPAIIEEPKTHADILNHIDDIFAPEPAPEPASPKLEEIHKPAPAFVEPAPPQPAINIPKPAEVSDDELEALLSKAAEDAAVSALEKLKTSDTKPPLLHPPSPAFRSGTTVEDMVADMLHPMLKEWVDTNLPAIVERIVEREVMRLTRR